MVTKKDIKKAIKETLQSTEFPQTVVMKLLNSYVNSGERLLTTLNDSLTEKNYDKMQRVFHDLKSTSLTLHFEAIAKMAAIAEIKALNEESYDYEELRNHFENHFRKLKAYLK